MKRILLALLAAMPFISWQPLAPMPEPKEQHGFENIGDWLYTVAGIDGNNVETRKAWCYHPDVDRWHRIADYPLAVQSMGLECCQGWLYGLGGYDHRDQRSGKTAACYRYNPSLLCWQSIASMHVPREDAGSLVMDGRIYVFGGITNPGHAVTQSYEVYDPNTDAWTLYDWPQTRCLGDWADSDGVLFRLLGGVTDMSRYPAFDGRAYCDLVFWMGEAILIGGVRDHTSCVLAAVDAVDLRFGGSRRLPDLPYAARGVGTVAVRDSLYVCGGWDGKRQRTDLYVLRSTR